jgi:hypothetical protein
MTEPEQTEGCPQKNGDGKQLIFHFPTSARRIFRVIPRALIEYQHHFQASTARIKEA